jgi:hypothetical protein
VKQTGLLLVVLVALSGQTPMSAPSAVRHLVYEFGYNTKAASAGNGTGTINVDIAPAKDGGLMISGADFWWNTVRARATNTCEVYAGGGVNCGQAPYALSPIQLTLFPLLARNYFRGLAATGTSATRTYDLKAAILPGASGMAGQLTTWACSYTLHGKGPIPNAAPFVLIQATGTLTQQNGHALKATSKQKISYDTVAKIPAFISDLRTHIPMKSVYSNDLVELKLMKDSMAKN